MFEMKVGLFFGSFNPVHKGHLEIASCFLDNTDLNEVWFVVSPQNPLKDDSELLAIDERLELVNAAIKENEGIKCCEVELGLPIPSYTIDTLRELCNTHPDYQFTIIMGTDNLEKLDLWKAYEEILQNFKLYVYPRMGSEAKKFQNHPAVTIIDSQLLEVSATILREQIRNQQYDKWLPDRVAQIIAAKGYYTN